MKERNNFQAQKNYIDLIADDIINFLEKEGPNISCAVGHNLKLLEAKKLGHTDHAIVWEGIKWLTSNLNLNYNLT